MKYLSGEYALNTRCSLNTAGDWHPFSYPLNKAKEYESDNSVFGDFGIEKHIFNGNEYYVANHIRAILDLMENGKIDYLYDFKKDFIVVDEYDQLIFEKVYLLKDNDKWESINKLMEHEYLLEWVKFLKKNNIINK